MAEPKKLGERLIEAGLITREALVQALEVQKSKPQLKLGECLLATRLISEQALLRFLAAEYQTRYVSGEKLRQVQIPTELLDRVPVRFAEAQLLLPLIFDAERQALSVVMAEPQNVAAIEELKLLAGMAEVYPFIGTRSAIQAAIRKHYYGDPTAFEGLDAANPAPAEVKAVAAFVENNPGSNSRSVPSAAMPMEGQNAQRPARDGQTQASGANPSTVQLAADLLQRSSLMSENDYIETLHVLVGMIELRRKDAFRFHSAAVAKHSRTIAQRMGLTHREVNFITIAAYLHDLGKRQDKHLTVLANAQSAELKAEARRFFKAPIRLFETVHLPVEVNSILAQVFEAYDGTGTPQGLKGESVPNGARILAAVDSFEDLTKNAQNAWGRLFTKEQALDLLQKQAGKLFDPGVVDLMRQIHTGEILRDRLLSDGRQAMVCHSDEAARTDLNDALGKQGVSSTMAMRSDAILSAVHQRDADLVIAEVSPQNYEGVFAVLMLMRQEPASAGIPVILLMSKRSPELEDRASGLRPVEVLTGELDPEVVAARAKALLDGRAATGAPGRPVSGLLDEMGFDDLLRTIAQAQRSGRLAFRGSGQSGELYIEKGRVVHAVCGEARGEQAVEMLGSLETGDFTLDPNFLILEQQMDKDVEVLLRETRRRKPAAPAAVPERTTGT